VPRPLPPSSKDAFRLPGERGQALLLHGYTGTPYEVRPVAEALSERGIGCHAPLLPGHGTTPRELNRVRAEAWLAAAHRAFDDLDPSKPRVVVGASMGGLLALLLAVDRAADVAGIALLAPALKFFPTGRLALALSAAGAVRVVDELRKVEQGGDLGDPEGRARNPCYTTLPVAGMGELSRLLRWTRRVLPDVKAPLCTVHGARDRTIEPAASGIVAREVSSVWVERYVLPRSRHVIGLDIERDRVCEIVCSFVDEVIARETVRETASVASR